LLVCKPFLLFVVFLSASPSVPAACNYSGDPAEYQILLCESKTNFVMLIKTYTHISVMFLPSTWVKRWHQDSRV